MATTTSLETARLLEKIVTNRPGAEVTILDIKKWVFKLVEDAEREEGVRKAPPQLAPQERLRLMINRDGAPAVMADDVPNQGNQDGAPF